MQRSGSSPSNSPSPRKNRPPAASRRKAAAESSSPSARAQKGEIAAAAAGAARPSRKRPAKLRRAAGTTEGARQLARLLDIMAQLRNPDSGCPWDLQQDLTSIKPYLIEEAYEVLDALESGSREHLAEELGDLLLQIVFQARIAQEEGAFSFADVARGISDKMIRRHPHIFGSIHVDSAADVLRNWDAIKHAENGKTARKSVLDAVPRSAPPLHRAYQIQQRAARVGFDWDRMDEAYAKLHEEVGELQEAVRSGIRKDIVSELGDVLFTVVNLARFVSCDPAYALTTTNNKFERRFRVLEAEITSQGRRLQDCTLPEMEAIWDRQRAEEHAAAREREAKKAARKAKKP